MSDRGGGGGGGGGGGCENEKLFLREVKLCQNWAVKGGNYVGVMG